MAKAYRLHTTTPMCRQTDSESSACVTRLVRVWWLVDFIINASRHAPSVKHCRAWWLLWQWYSRCSFSVTDQCTTCNGPPRRERQMTFSPLTVFSQQHSFVRNITYARQSRTNFHFAISNRSFRYNLFLQASYPLGGMEAALYTLRLHYCAMDSGSILRNVSLINKVHTRLSVQSKQIDIIQSILVLNQSFRGHSQMKLDVNHLRIMQCW